MPKMQDNAKNAKKCKRKMPKEHAVEDQLD